MAALFLGLSAGSVSGQVSWELRAVRTAGEFRSAIEFGSITAVALGPAGVYVGDGLNSRVVILDSLLDPVGMVGRAGSGPAEFRSIAALTVRGDTIYAHDVRLGRLNAITTAGEPVWTQTRVPRMADEVVSPHPGAVLADGAILVRGRAGPGSPAHGLHRFDRVSRERVRIATMGHSADIPIGRVDYEGLTSTVNRPVHAADRSAVAPGGVFVAILIQSDPAEPGEGTATISVLNPTGDTVWAHTLRTPKVPMDADDVASVVAENATAYAERVSQNFGVPRGAARKAYEEALAIPPYQLSFDRLLAGGEGAVLLRRGGYGLDEVEWWRMTESGLDAVFTLPAGHEVVAVAGSRIYTVSLGPLDEPILTLWSPVVSAPTASP